MESGIPPPKRYSSASRASRRSFTDEPSPNIRTHTASITSTTTAATALPNDTDERKVIVCVRVRPLNSKEISQGDKSCWQCVNGNKLREILPSGDDGKDLYFDYVFDESFSTQVVYDKMGYGILDGVLHGYNGTIFAYGQTSSGKTHTLMGNDEEPGLIVLAVQDIFDTIKEMESHDFLIRASYVEIYNEEIKDLLANGEDQGKITIIEDKVRGPHLKGVTEEVVVNTDQVLQLLATGETQRHFGCTNMNARSSRSHTLFKMTFESRESTEAPPQDLTTAETNGSESGGSSISASTSRIVEQWENTAAVKVAALNLVDLAGSERIAKTNATGTQLKEGAMINKSLLTLGTVISQLSNSKSSGHIPYRDSKLTRLLSTSLGGNAKTAMISAISPAESNRSETKSTLQFAKRAQRIVNKVTANVVNSDSSQLNEYKAEIEKLKQQLKTENSDSVALMQKQHEEKQLALEAQAREEKAKAEEIADQLKRMQAMILNVNKLRHTNKKEAENLSQELLEVSAGRKRLGSVAQVVSARSRRLSNTGSAALKKIALLRGKTLHSVNEEASDDDDMDDDDIEGSDGSSYYSSSSSEDEHRVKDSRVKSFSVGASSNPVERWNKIKSSVFLTPPDPVQVPASPKKRRKKHKKGRSRAANRMMKETLAMLSSENETRKIEGLRYERQHREDFEEIIRISKEADKAQEEGEVLANELKAEKESVVSMAVENEELQAQIVTMAQEYQDLENDTHRSLKEIDALAESLQAEAKKVSMIKAEREELRKNFEIASSTHEQQIQEKENEVLMAKTNYNNMIQHLNSELTESQENGSVLRTERDSLRTQCEELQIALSTEKKEHQGTRCDLTEKHSKLNEELLKSKERYSISLKEAEDSKNEIHRMQEQFETERKEVQSTIWQTKKTLEENLQQQLKELRDAFAEEKASLQESQDKEKDFWLAEQRELKLKLEESSEALRGEVDGSKQKAEQAILERNALTENIKMLKDELVVVGESSAKKLKSLENDLRSCTVKLSDTSDQFEKFRSLHRNCEDQQVKSAARYKDLQDKLSSAYEKAETYSNKATDKEVQLEEKQAQLEGLKTDVVKMTEEISKLRAQCDSESATRSTLEKDLDCIKSKGDKTNVEVRQMQQQIEDYKERNNKLMKDSFSHSVLVQQWEGKEKQYEESLNSKHSEIARLQADIDLYSEKIKQVSTQESETRLELYSSREEVIDMQNAIRDSEFEATQSQKRIERLEKALEASKLSCSKFKEELEQLRRNTELFSNELATSKQKNQTLNSQVRELSAKLNSAVENLSRANEKAQAETSAKSKLEARALEAESALQAAKIELAKGFESSKVVVPDKSEMNRVQLQLKEKVAYCADLEKEIKDFKDRLEVSEEKKLAETSLKNELEAARREQQFEIDTIREDKAELESEVCELSEYKNSLQAQIEQEMVARAVVEEKYESVSEKLLSLQEELYSFKSEHEQLVRANSSMEEEKRSEALQEIEYQAELKKYREKIVKLTGKINSMDSEYSQLEDSLREESEKRQYVQSELNSSSLTQAALEEEIHKLQMEKEDHVISIDYEKLAVEKMDLVNEVKQLTESLKSVREGTGSTQSNTLLEAISQVPMSSTLVLNQLKENSAALQSELREARLQIQELQKQNSGLLKDSFRAESLQQAEKELRKENEMMLEMLKSSKIDLESQGQTILKLEKQIMVCNERAERNQGLRNEESNKLLAIKKELNDMREDRIKYQSELHISQCELENAKLDIVSMSKQCATAKDLQEMAESTLRNVSGKSDKEVEDLTLKFQQVRDLSTELRAQLSLADEEVSLSKDMLLRSQQKVESLVHDRVKAIEQRDEAHKRIKEMQSKMNAANAKFITVSQKYEQLSQEHHRSSDITDAERENGITLRELQTELESAKRELHALSCARTKGLENRLATEIYEKAKLKQRVQSLQNDLGTQKSDEYSKTGRNTSSIDSYSKGTDARIKVHKTNTPKFAPDMVAPLRKIEKR